MSEHLPECLHEPFPYDDPYENPCICDRLRACRERTLDEAKAAVTDVAESIDPVGGFSFDEAIWMSVAAIDALKADGVSPSNPTA